MVLEQTPQCPGVSLSFLILSPFLTDPLKEGTRSTLNLGRFVQTPTESSGVCGRGLTIFDEPLREGRDWGAMEVLKAKGEKARWGCGKDHNKQPSC